MHEFKAGDRVIHPKCPDWGVGEVLQGGQQGPKVRALFDRAGLKMVLAAHLEPAPPVAPVRRERPPW